MIITNYSNVVVYTTTQSFCGDIPNNANPNKKYYSGYDCVVSTNIGARIYHCAISANALRFNYTHLNLLKRDDSLNHVMVYTFDAHFPVMAQPQ